MANKPKTIRKSGSSTKAPAKSQSTATRPTSTEKDFARDIDTFEQLPEKDKELNTLKDAAERSIGPANVDLNKTIHEKAK